MVYGTKFSYKCLKNIKTNQQLNQELNQEPEIQIPGWADFIRRELKYSESPKTITEI